MKILVTGATGNVGGVVVEELKAKGADVSAGVRDVESEKAKALGVPLVPFDFASGEEMATAMTGFDRVFLILPLTKEMRTWGSHSVIAAKDAGVKLVVRISCMGADPNAHFQLGKIHGAIDADLSDAKIPFVTLRAATFMQNYVDYYAAGIKATGKLMVPERDSKTSFVDLRDLGAAAACVLVDPEPVINKHYVVTGPEALTNAEVAGCISNASGRDVTYESVEIEDYGLGMEQAGFPEWNIHMILSVHRYARSDYTSFKTQAVKYLSGKPAKSFAEFAAEFADAWK